MKQYHDMLMHIIDNGVDKKDRTGVGTRSVFGYQMRFDLQQGFPLVTTKKTSFGLIATELLWFLQGNPDINYLHANNNHIWDEWVKEDGTFGPIYGQQWRQWPLPFLDDDGYIHNVESIDQIANVINKLKHNPNDRRMIVSAWNVADVEAGNMALPPCHVLFQFYIRTVNNRTFLDCQLYQRSCDSFLGVPFNIASYSLLVHMIAHVVGMEPGEFIWTGGDVHIYHNHFDQVGELLQRDPVALPRLHIVNQNDIGDIDDFRLRNFALSGYMPYAAIKAPIAV